MSVKPTKTTKKTKAALDRKLFASCPFCDGKIVEKYAGIRDRLDTTTETFTVYECTNCGMALLNPIPVGDVSKYYPTNYLSGEDEAQAPASGKFDLEQWYRYNQYKYDFHLLERATGVSLKTASSYIDIGCGSGERVAFATAQGCRQASGVDKFDFAKSSSKQDVKIVNSEVLDYKPTQKFQVASLFHVLEHVDNPQDILTHIRTSILAKGGQLIIQVPNYGSIERRVFGRKWFSFDVPRHLWQFNDGALRKLLEQTGYTVEASYQLNAPLHPVSILPSINRELDIQRIWVNRSHGSLYKRLMTILWAGLTILAVPLVILQNLFHRSSMLTVVASSK